MANPTNDIIASTLEFLRKENVYVRCYKKGSTDSYTDVLLYGFLTKQWWIYSYNFQAEDVLNIIIEPNSLPIINIK